MYCHVVVVYWQGSGKFVPCGPLCGISLTPTFCFQAFNLIFLPNFTLLIHWQNAAPLLINGNKIYTQHTEGNPISLPHYCLVPNENLSATSTRWTSLKPSKGTWPRRSASPARLAWFHLLSRFIFLYQKKNLHHSRAKQRSEKFPMLKHIWTPPCSKTDFLVFI